MEKNLTHFSSTNFLHHLTSEQHRGYKAASGEEKIFFTSIRPQYSLAFSSQPANCGVDSNTVESSLDEIYVNTRKKKNSLKEGSVREREKTIVYYNQQTRKKKKEKNCCLLIVTEVFMLPLFFLLLLCIYRLNKIQMSESTREGPLFAFTINRRLLFFFLS